ncbi:MAG TPA: hypothetical protein VGS22_13895 [Thermoanaerobaculia bacterium]|nr:hypothetical protein [Thermoanaerobaculia bacterium]
MLLTGALDDIALHPQGAPFRPAELGARRFSTAGLVSGIWRLAQMFLAALTVSLNAKTEEMRSARSRLLRERPQEPQP